MAERQSWEKGSFSLLQAGLRALHPGVHAQTPWQWKGSGNLKPSPRPPRTSKVHGRTPPTLQNSHLSASVIPAFPQFIIVDQGGKGGRSGESRRDHCLHTCLGHCGEYKGEKPQPASQPPQDLGMGNGLPMSSQGPSVGHVLRVLVKWFQ